MAATHTTAIRNGFCTNIINAVDAGAGAGQLVYMTSGDVEVATLTFSDPSFGAPASGVITANTIARDENATGGEAALFKFVDSDGTEVVRGSISATGGGGDIELSNTTITAGEPVECSSLTYTAPV